MTTKRFWGLSYRKNLPPTLFKYRKRVFLGLWLIIWLLLIVLFTVKTLEGQLNITSPNFLSDLAFYLLFFWFAFIVAGGIWVMIYIHTDS